MSRSRKWPARASSSLTAADSLLAAVQPLHVDMRQEGLRSEAEDGQPSSGRIPQSQRALLLTCGKAMGSQTKPD